MSLSIGKKFKIISNGQVVNIEIIGLDGKFAIILLNGKKFRVHKEKIINVFSDYEIEKNDKHQSKCNFQNKCKYCMEYRNGNCFGESKICNDFRPSPEISKEEVNNWPKYGSVSRSKSDKFFIREYDDMYNKYHEVYH